MTEAIGGFNIRFDIASFALGSSIELQSNIQIIEGGSYPTSVVIINKQSDRIVIMYGTDRYHLSYYFDYMIDNAESFRILFHDEFCTIYIDNSWAYTFSFDYVGYPQELSLNMFYFDGTEESEGTCQISNLVIQELCDWRDAIYIDLDTTASSAIQSVIQQRPIEIVPRYDGALQFYYEPEERDTVPLSFLTEVRKIEEESKTACSDAIVYYSDVNVLSDDQTAEEIGFITRIYKLSELDHGALKAARVMQKKARQSVRKYRVQGRLNLALEIGDVATIEFTAVDTQDSYSESFIVEAIQTNIANGEAYMAIEGRSNE